MATIDVSNDLFLSPPPFDQPKGANAKSRGLAIEKKIEFLEGLYGKVSNRRSRRWLNDRLLMELVPRLDGEEIRSLFSPPPWGDDVPQSAFSMTNIGEWDKFRHGDMDKEATMIQALESSCEKRKNRMDANKMHVLKAWHRVDCRTRETLRRNFLSSAVNDYEERVRAFINDGIEGDELVIHVQDPFHRLLLHGICEYYNLVSVTISEPNGLELLKMTTIKKKKASSVDIPNITLCEFLNMAKQGIW